MSTTAGKRSNQKITAAGQRFNLKKTAATERLNQKITAAGRFNRGLPVAALPDASSCSHVSAAGIAGENFH